MAYRNIIVTRNIGISVHNYQLVIGNEDMCVPLEDINCLVLEHAGIMISSGVLQRLSGNGCLVYICDEKHLPSTVVLPIARHSRHFKMLTAQLAITKPRQNRIWQQIVKQKIANQTNVEAQAAALYFKSLFGNDFTRGDDNGINAALNYGYSILRGHISRSIVCYGFEPSLGINHHSQLNNFNLADDFIEPYRAIVDYFVYTQLHMEEGKELSKEMRYQLVDIVNYDMDIHGEKHVIHHAIDKMVASYNSILMGNKDELEIPELIELERHNYE